MESFIQAYIDDKALAWSHNTQRSERHRLMAVKHNLNGDPMVLWSAIQYQKPYSRLTTWVRVCQFWNYLIEKGIQTDNPYEHFRQKNQKAFKHVYNPKPVKIDFEDAVSLIRLIGNDFDRQLAVQIIGSGERYAEAVQSTDAVVGKGNKQRNTYRPNAKKGYFGRSYHSFRRSLKSVGLKPHDLRKLFATKLVEKGMKEADLLKVMGWSSITTAKAYLQPKKEAEIKDIIGEIHEQILR